MPGRVRAPAAALGTHHVAPLSVLGSRADGSLLDVTTAAGFTACPADGGGTAIEVDGAGWATGRPPMRLSLSAAGNADITQARP